VERNRDVDSRSRCALAIRLGRQPSRLAVKKISEQQRIGQQGVHLLGARLLSVGLSFHPNGPLDAGIDGFLELRDPDTGEVRAQWITAQLKTQKEGRFPNNQELSYHARVRREGLSMAENSSDYDEQLKKFQLQTAEVELKLKEKELRDQLGPWRIQFNNPVVLGAIITAFVALNTVMVSLFTAQLQASLEEKKLQTQLAVDRAKMESSLLVDIIKVGDPDRAATNIKFFLDAGYLSDPGGRIKSYLMERIPNQGLGLPTKDRKQ
jgi:hypothetical protein